jgi:hypothetical protein
MCPIGKAMEISPCELISIVRGKISIMKGNTAWFWSLLVV